MFVVGFVAAVCVVSRVLLLIEMGFRTTPTLSLSHTQMRPNSLFAINFRRVTVLHNLHLFSPASPHFRSLPTRAFATGGLVHCKISTTPSGRLDGKPKKPWIFLIGKKTFEIFLISYT